MIPKTGPSWKKENKKTPGGSADILRDTTATSTGDHSADPCDQEANSLLSAMPGAGDHNEDPEREGRKKGDRHHLDDSDIDPIEPDPPRELETTDTITTMDQSGTTHIHDDGMCIQCGTFWFEGGLHCLNPECVSNIPPERIWDEWFDHDPVTQATYR